MKFSKEFTDWWEKYLKDNKVPVDKLVGYKTTYHDYFTEQWFINAEAVYDAFKAHDEELKRLRQFEKKFRTLQDKIAEYEGKSADCYFSNPNKSVNYEAKAEELKDELLYL